MIVTLDYKIYIFFFLSEFITKFCKFYCQKSKFKKLKLFNWHIYVSWPLLFLLEVFLKYSWYYFSFKKTIPKHCISIWKKKSLSFYVKYMILKKQFKSTVFQYEKRIVWASMWSTSFWKKQSTVFQYEKRIVWASMWSTPFLSNQFSITKMEKRQKIDLKY